MKLIRVFFLIIGLFITPRLNAQHVTELVVEQVGQKVLVHYSLWGDSSYDVYLYVKTEGDARWQGPLNAVIGDVGPGQRPGSNKIISWDVLAERDKLVGDWVFGIQVKDDKIIKEAEQQAQTVSKGNVIINPYYGGPNLGKSLAKTLNTTSEISISGIGPAGIRLEYMLADRFGMGVDFIYNTFVFKYSEVDSVGATWSYKNGMNRTRIHLRFNYHLSSSNENLDRYLGLGAGTNNRKWYYGSDELGYIAADEVSATAIPFSMRLAFGIRYYFLENLGLNAEIGIGGPIVSAGLSVKF